MTRPPMPTSPLLVCHSHLRWDWVYQRPQHLLSRLARRWPVLFEEEPVVDGRPPGVDLLAVAEGVTVLRPHHPPDRPDSAGASVEAHVAMVRGRRPLVRWFYSPMFATHGNRLGPGQVVVFDCMDELANFAGAPQGLARAEDQLLTRADVVFAGGRALHEARRGRRPDIRCFPSAVDSNHFAGAGDPDLPLPADLIGLPRPIFGYHGVVDERLDYGLIARLADAPGVGSVVLVGPMTKVDPSALPRRSNLHYLGQRPYADLPGYLKGFDVGIMPWALNEATRSISPTKTLEFMAAGRPIVSTAVRDVVRNHGDIVLVADEPSRFVAMALDASKRPDLGRIEAGRCRAEQSSWDAVAEAMARLIEAHLPGDGQDRRASTALSTRPVASA